MSPQDYTRISMELKKLSTAIFAMKDSFACGDNVLPMDYQDESNNGSRDLLSEGVDILSSCVLDAYTRGYDLDNHGAGNTPYGLQCCTRLVGLLDNCDECVNASIWNDYKIPGD